MERVAELGFPAADAVEGLDGSGKSTQITRSSGGSRVQGLKVISASGTAGALVKSATSKGKKMTVSRRLSLIHAIDRRSLRAASRPLLRAGYIVLCDRYIFTAFVR